MSVDSDYSIFLIDKSAVKGTVNDSSCFNNHSSDLSAVCIKKGLKTTQFISLFKVMVMTLIAILLPWLSFLLRGKLISGFVCLILQITVIGWLPAAAWAVISLQNARADRRTRRIVRSMQHAN